LRGTEGSNPSLSVIYLFAIVQIGR
jgi:hypothetical protein